MPNRDVVVIGASAGGTEAAIELVRSLPPELPAALFFVRHLSSHAESYLVSALAAATAFEVKSASDGERFRPGCLYVAPPDQHLLLAKGTMRLSRSPRVNGWRPAID